MGTSKNRAIRLLIALCRVVLGLSLVFSGLTKGVDPMGGAIQIGEYLTAFDMEWLRGAEYFFSIALSTGEATLGMLLIFAVRMRAASAAALAFMAAMTALTLYIAIENPVADCGCFGEAVKLSNWGTFLKNALFLLPLGAVVAWDSWIAISRRGTWRDWAFGAAFALLFTGISLWGVRHLPLIDFLPYKVGVDIPRGIAGGGAEQTLVRYRNMATGEQVDFQMSDTTWWDASKWEYVDTITADDEPRMGRSVDELAIMDGGADVTMELLDRPGGLLLICVADRARLPRRCGEALGDLASLALEKGYRVAALTPQTSPGGGEMAVAWGQTVKWYNMDDVVLKSLLRADAGAVVLDGGTITGKVNCRDITRNRAAALLHRE